MKFSKLSIPKNMKFGKNKLNLNSVFDEHYYLRVQCYPYDVFLKTTSPEQNFIIKRDIYM